MKNHYFLSILISLQFSSSYAITNGVEIKDSQFPSVVSLYDTEVDFSFCTGTFIEEDVVLTAGHCVEDFFGDVDLEYKEIRQANNSFEIIDYAIHPDFDYENSSDIALLKVSSASKFTSKITKGPISVKEKVDLIGFGMNFFDFGLLTKMQEGELSEKQMMEIIATTGVKRHGKNSIGKIGDLTISFEAYSAKRSKKAAAGQNSGASKGDSGGPLFNSSGELLGVARETNTATSTGIHQSEYINLTNPSISGFIIESINEFQRVVED